MALIKEPLDVDFFVESQPLSDTERAAISDFIKNYKKKNAKDQSLWNSDTTRLTYFVRDPDTKENVWKVDKKGIRTTELIITPFLEYIVEKLEIYIDGTMPVQFVSNVNSS